MDQSEHTLDPHAGHGMHGHEMHGTEHTLHDHVVHDHGALIASTAPTTTILAEDMPAAMEHMHHNHAPTTTGQAMLHSMMTMSFHFGYTETILFDWWTIDSVKGLVVSMLVIFITAFLYEGLKYYREFLFWKTYNVLEYRPVTGPQRNPESGQIPAATTSASPVQYVGEVIHKQPPTMFSVNHIIQTFLHMIQVTISFLLMLIFMTYNVWLCLAVVLGAGVGYFLFCWKKSVIVDVTEHCH